MSHRGSQSGADDSQHQHQHPSDTDSSSSNMQTNTSNPLKKNLMDIILSKSVPPLSALLELKGALANQEDKLHAMKCGMIVSLFKHYGNCFEDTPEIQSIRVCLVQMLRSFAMLTKGRSIIFEQIGTPRVLHLLSDPAPQVRVAACAMLATLSGFPDSKKEVHTPDRLMILSLVHAFLNDPEQSVTDAAIQPIQQLTFLDPLLDEPTLRKLGGIIVRTSAGAAAGEREALALLKSTLQVVWNCSLHSAEKEIAIAVGLVDVLVPLLENSHDTETMRCASGVLASLAISERGKEAIIAQPGAIAQACKLTLDKRTALASHSLTAVRSNSVALIRNFTENPRGLHAVGRFLIPSPEVLIEILGMDQTANVLAPRIGQPLYADVQGNDDDGIFTDSNTATPSSAPQGAPLVEVTELLWTLRALFHLMKNGGTPGRVAAWRILDIVPRLYDFTQYNPPAAAGQAAQQQENLNSIHSTASRCLILLCEENDDARLELVSLSKRIGEAATRRCDVFAAVEGNYQRMTQEKAAAAESARAAAAQAQAQAAAEAEAAALAAKQAEEEEAAAAAVAVAEEQKAQQEEERAKAEAEGGVAAGGAEAAAAAVPSDSKPEAAAADKPTASRINSTVKASA